MQVTLVLQIQLLGYELQVSVGPDQQGDVTCLSIRYPLSPSLELAMYR